MCVCVCVCEREREREREIDTQRRDSAYVYLDVCKSEDVFFDLCA